jgi:uncharacterized protein
MAVKVVKAFQSKGVYMGTVAYGKDILETLEAFCLENEIRTAWVNLLGALSEVTLAYYEQEGHQYVTQTFTGEYEILNGTGNITMKEHLPVGHIHLTLSNTEFGCVGGHLVKGSAKVFACEFMLHAVEGHEPLFRGGPDEETGLPLWIY